MAVHRLELLPEERILVDIRPHWLFLSGPLVLSLLVVAAGVALDVGIPHTSVDLHWVEGLCVAVPCAWLALRAVRWRRTSLVITSERIIEQWGVVSRRRSEMSLASIASVTAVQTVIRRVLGAGRLELELWEDDEIRWIQDVRKPVILRRVINRRLHARPQAGSDLA